MRIIVYWTLNFNIVRPWTTLTPLVISGQGHRAHRKWLRFKIFCIHATLYVESRLLIEVMKLVFWSLIIK